MFLNKIYRNQFDEKLREALKNKDAENADVAKLKPEKWEEGPKFHARFNHQYDKNLGSESAIQDNPHEHGRKDSNINTHDIITIGEDVMNLINRDSKSVPFGSSIMSNNDSVNHSKATKKTDWFLIKEEENSDNDNENDVSIMLSKILENRKNNSKSKKKTKIKRKHIKKHTSTNISENSSIRSPFGSKVRFDTNMISCKRFQNKALYRWQ